MSCSLYVHILFDRSGNTYIDKSCRLDHEGRMTNQASIVDHLKCERDVYNEEKDQLHNF